TDSRFPRSRFKSSTRPRDPRIASSAAPAFSADRHAMKTCAPCPASSRAVTRPIPVFAPVTRATLPASTSSFFVPVVMSPLFARVRVGAEIGPHDALLGAVEGQVQEPAVEAEFDVAERVGALGVLRTAAAAVAV